MPHFMDIAQGRLVFDLIWSRTAETARSPIKQIAGNANLAVTVANPDGDSIAGLLKLDEKNKKLSRSKIFSFAALVATHFKNEKAILLFVAVDDNDAIMTCIRSGLPVPDFDRYGPMQELMEIAEEFLGESKDAKIIGATELFGRVNPFDFKTFIASKETARLLRKARLKSVNFDARPLIVAGITAACGLYAGYDYFHGIQQKEEAARVAVAQKPADQIYAEALPAAIAQQGISRKSATDLVAFANAQSITANGWRISAMRCTAGGCTQTWVRDISSSSYRDLINAIGKDNVSFATDQTASKAVSFPTTEPVRVDMSKLPLEQDGLISLLGPIQKLGGRIVLGIGSSTKFPAGGVTPKGAIKKGEIKMQGPLWGLEVLSGLPNWVVVRDINYSLKNAKPTFEATLVFFTR